MAQIDDSLMSASKYSKLATNVSKAPQSMTERASAGVCFAIERNKYPDASLNGFCFCLDFQILFEVLHTGYCCIIIFKCERVSPFAMVSAIAGLLEAMRAIAMIAKF